jgi:hypothetical protein
MAKPRLPKKTSNDMPTTPILEAASSEVVASETNGNGAALNGARTTVRKKIVAKPEIVKSEARATIVPINVEEEIRRLAYLMSERRGFEPGHEADDWFAAEREIRQRYHQHSA